MKLKLPPWLNVILLVLGSTALYTYIGQLVPQKMVLPPVETVIPKNLSSADLAQVGRGIAEGKGLCLTCHTIGKSGSLRFPDLQGIATRAGERIPGVDSLHYMAMSIYHPDQFIVPGFNPGMPKIDKPPIALNDQEIVAVIAFLQSLGGTPSVTPETTKAELGVE
jgi:mono/diheme cytochrome c family protein